MPEGQEGAGGLAARFLDHAATRPEEPWLFLQEGWDWRWTAFGEVAGRAAATAEAVGDLAPGARVGYAARLSPALVAADLALQAAGLVAVPIDPELAPPERREAVRARQCCAWLELGDDSPVEAPVPLVRRAPSLEAAKVGSLGALQDSVPAAFPARQPGGALVVTEGECREIDAGSLVELARALAETLGPGPKREITVLARCLEEPLARLLLAWATLSGAAVVLEPDGVAFLTTAAWARPTVLAGTAADLETALVRAEAGGKGPRSPFGRLRFWLVAESEGVPHRVAARWQARGVGILPVTLPG